VVYPEWWGADNTGATSSSTAFAAMALCQCYNVKLLPGGTYRIKDVALPGVSKFKLDAQMATIVADGIDGDPATSCFTVTFDSASTSVASWLYFWEFENVVINTSGSYGYMVDFLVINIINSALITDIHIRNIKGKGGLQGTGDPMNSMFKIVKSSTSTPENVNITQIQANGINVDRVLHVTSDSTSKGISGKFEQIYHAVYDGNAQTIYADCTITRSEFKMIYNPGGVVLDIYSCQNSKLERIYQEAMINDARVLKGIYSHCAMSNIITVAQAGKTGEKLFEGTMIACTTRCLEHYHVGTIGAEKTVILGALSTNNYIEDLWSTGDADRYYFEAVDDSGYNNSYGSKGRDGVWIPTLTGLDTAGTITLDAAYDTCYYNRIGNMVYFSGLLQVDSVDGTQDGLLRISIPFTAATGAQYSAAVSIAANVFNSGPIEALMAYIETGLKYIYVYAYHDGAAGHVANYVKAGTTIRISGTYMAKNDYL
jgi:hypothetical protein